jgi:hypothetical protein
LCHAFPAQSKTKSGGFSLDLSAAFRGFKLFSRPAVVVRATVPEYAKMFLTRLWAGQKCRLENHFDAI